MGSTDQERLETLIPLLRCPATGLGIRLDGGRLAAADDLHTYPLIDGIPDLRRAPDRLRLDLPWYEPWDEVDAICLSAPEPLSTKDLPYHLDAHMAGVMGADGGGARVLEIGCGERLCERYFKTRGFEYVGTDVERRGPGPNVYADGHNLPFADASFDYYLSLAVYEHLTAPWLAVKEAYRVLRPGGRLCCTADFMFGFHDHASFFHMSHAAWLCLLRSVGFEVERIWPDWRYVDSVPQMAFGQGPDVAWRTTAKVLLRALEGSYLIASDAARLALGKKPINLDARGVHTAGSLSVVARKAAC